MLAFSMLVRGGNYPVNVLVVMHFHAEKRDRSRTHFISKRHCLSHCPVISIRKLIFAFDKRSRFRRVKYLLLRTGFCIGEHLVGTTTAKRKLASIITRSVASKLAQKIPYQF